MSRRCELGCKSEGPPGPVWCSVCGHDPKCCTCDDRDVVPVGNPSPQETNSAPETDATEAADHTTPDPDLQV